jgi:hypothetical protein
LKPSSDILIKENEDTGYNQNWDSYPQHTEETLENKEITTKLSGSSEMNQIGHRHQRRFEVAGRRDEEAHGRS